MTRRSPCHAGTSGRVVGPGFGALTLALALAVAPWSPAASAQRASATRPPDRFTEVAAAAGRARDAGEVDQAIALYRRAVALRPAWDEGQWYLGTMLYEQGRPREARAAFSQVLRVHPEHAGALAMSGLCAFREGEHEAALRLLLRSRQLHIQRTPELATVVRYHTGILLTRFGEFEAGNQVLVELAAEGAESPQTVEAFGVNLLRMPLLPSEVSAEARPRVQLAGEVGVAIATRQVARAQTLVEQLVDSYGAAPHVHYVAGAFLLSQDPPRGVALLRKELEISPQHVLARLQLAFEFVKQGDVAAARPYAEAAVQMAPRDVAPRLALGQVLVGVGDVAAAITHIEEAVRLAPSSPQARFLLSTAYARAGREADAARERAAFTRLGGTGASGSAPP